MKTETIASSRPTAYSDHAAPPETRPLTRVANHASGWKPFSPSVMRSRPVRDLLAQQTLRAEDQHQDEDSEGPDILPRAALERGGRVAGRHRLDDAERQAAQHGAVDVADAAE